MLVFVRKLLLGLVAIAVIVNAVILMRVLWCWRAMDEAYKLERGAKVLVVGSSQAGCSFNAKDGYKILWVEASPPQIVYFRLKKFLERNATNDLRLIVTDFGPQTFCLQSKERMPRFWYRELPLTYAHLREMPCAVSDFLTFACSHLQMPFNFDQRWDGAGRPSLAEKSHEWKRERLAETLKSHYHHYTPPPIWREC